MPGGQRFKKWVKETDRRTESARERGRGVREGLGGWGFWRTGENFDRKVKEQSQTARAWIMRPPGGAAVMTQGREAGGAGLDTCPTKKDILTRETKCLKRTRRRRARRLPGGGGATGGALVSRPEATVCVRVCACVCVSRGPATSGLRPLECLRDWLRNPLQPIDQQFIARLRNNPHQ